MMKAFTEKIFSLDKVKITSPLPSKPQESLAQGDCRIDSLQMQNHHDIEKLFELSIDWLAN